MNTLQRDFGSAIILITHDLGVVAETADDVLVMYAAKPAEQGAYQRHLLPGPAIPYTWGLMRSLPRLAGEGAGADARSAGSPPSLLRPPPGCRFHLRCPYVMDVCSQDRAAASSPCRGTDAHRAACHLDADDRSGARPRPLVTETMASTR